jgi:hypothetical protein
MPVMVVVVVVVAVTVVVVVVGHGPHSSVPPQPSGIIPQSAAPHGFGVQTHCPVASHESGAVQVPHEPPQPSAPHSVPAQFGTHWHTRFTHCVPLGQTVPHVPQLLVSLARFTHSFPQTPSPVGQQRPNRAFAFLAMGFAQFRLQQLMGVAHTWLFGLQPLARASQAVLTRSAGLTTSARRAVRQSDFASDMGGVPPGADAAAHRGLKSRRKNDGVVKFLK